MSKKADELVYKFINTGEEKYFNQLMAKYENIIKYKVNAKIIPVFRRDFNYIVNWVRIRIWRALKENYDSIGLFLLHL